MKPTEHFQYTPDHACPPGQLIEEYLGELDISARELARRCGRSGKLISEIVAGKAPIEPETALQLERVLDVPASIWINMEANFQLHQARETETETLASQSQWAKMFPLNELSDRGLISLSSNKSEQVSNLLKFFGVGSVKACEERIEDLMAVDFRTSSSFKNDDLALAVWLRIGELKAQAMETKEYDRDAFLNALKEIRELTLISVDKALPKLREKCAAAGVVFVLEKPFSKVRASGVSRWLSPRKALIQQTFRHLSDDHFWFTFFHECAHILLHSRKEIFIDMNKGPGTGDPLQEAEANAWAADFLIPSKAMRKFIAGFQGSEDEIRRFASKQGIAPGIVVGQLQHSGVIGFSELNRFKTRYEWI